ncbi:MAG: pyruvate formate lyase family protein, partial [candidate division WOR-3 bacterium]
MKGTTSNVRQVLEKVDWNERIHKYRQKMLRIPEICIERGYYWTESYMQTEGEPEIIRRAKALKHVLQNISITIDENDIIAGRTTSKIRGALLMPEIQWEWYLKDMDTFHTREWDRFAPLTEEEKKLMREFLPYWKGKCLYERWLRMIPEPAKKLHFSNTYVVNTGCVSGMHLAHTAVDYHYVLSKGLLGIKQEVQNRLNVLELSDHSNFRRYLFYQAVLIAIEGALTYAERCAQIISELAEKVENPQRKSELFLMAQTCKKVPLYPPENFYEAIQFLWFLCLIQRIEAFGPGISLGRLDQILYPYYLRDLQNGLISEQIAKGLLAMLLIKLNDVVPLFSSEFVEQLAGFPTLANVTVGGETVDGEDAVNSLTFLILDAEEEVRLTAEELVVRVSPKNPDSYLKKACQLAKEARGKIKFVGDPITIQMMLTDGNPRARDYVVVGCFTPTVVANSFHTSASMVNLPLLLELALNNGKSRLLNLQLGPATGNPADFASYEEVWEAYKKQVEAAVPWGIVNRNIDRQLYAEFAPCPFLSCLYPPCIEKGLDVTWGGLDPYQTEGHGILGVANVADSLAVIKKLVFEEKVIKMREL